MQRNLRGLSADVGGQFPGVQAVEYAYKDFFTYELDFLALAAATSATTTR